MTPQVKAFLERHKEKLTGNVLEVGSYNVNGSARDVIDVSVGLDIRRGPGVDLVCSINDLFDHFEKDFFDGIVSTETLEHVEDWRAFVQNTWDAVKTGGYLVMTMASMQKGRHAYPDDYWRMTLEEIQRIYPRAEYLEKLGKSPNRYPSIGWVVKKEGELGSLDFEPYKVP